MRHRKSGLKLGRTSSHRQAMFQNMTNSLFEHELIKTTLPKAKELRRVAEPLITLAKKIASLIAVLLSAVCVAKQWLVSYLVNLDHAIKLVQVVICVSSSAVIVMATMHQWLMLSL